MTYIADLIGGEERLIMREGGGVVRARDISRAEDRRYPLGGARSVEVKITDPSE